MAGRIPLCQEARVHPVATLNASPIKAAVLAAVRRHVTVELWLDLGFNDKSESMPFQGGTNEQVVTAFYRQLRREGKGDEKYLEVYWYTGKDMTRPLNAVRKQRNCHVKFAAFDGHVAVLGSGNQDTQSWFHSQEINVMVDSKQIVDEWMAALTRNQSTKLYGMVDQRDGIWRGRDGQELVDTGKDTASKEKERTPHLRRPWWKRPVLLRKAPSRRQRLRCQSSRNTPHTLCPSFGHSFTTVSPLFWFVNRRYQPRCTHSLSLFNLKAYIM